VGVKKRIFEGVSDRFSVRCVGRDGSVGTATPAAVPGSNAGGGEIFRTRPYWPWGPPSLLYNGYRVSFPGLKWPGRGVKLPPPSRVEVKEGVTLGRYGLF
jgi:hypothetical protein